MNNLERIKKDFNAINDVESMAYYIQDVFNCFACPCFPCDPNTLVVDEDKNCLDILKKYLSEEVEEDSSLIV